MTRHARHRMSARRVGKAAIEAALAYGRLVHIRGAETHTIGRKEVFRYRRQGVDLRAFEGVQVVCRPGSRLVLTAYRNRDFRGLRPHEYFGVDVEEVWATVERELPELKRKLRMILPGLSKGGVTTRPPLPFSPLSQNASSGLST